jgi:hypothetical protein
MSPDGQEMTHEAQIPEGASAVRTRTRVQQNTRSCGVLPMVSRTARLRQNGGYLKSPAGNAW